MAGAPPDGRPRRLDHAVSVFALFLVLLCLIPPDGALSDNEENYFQLAAQSVGAMPTSSASAVFDSSRHRILADHLLGWLIELLGFTGAEIAARALLALAYAVALAMLFRRFALETIEGMVVVIVLALLGQTLFGGEWLFDGAEAKVPAYALVLAGLALTMDGKQLRAMPLFVAATYFHFLVGIFWFLAAIVLALIEDRRDLRRPLAATALFAGSVVPLIGLIASTRLAEAGAGTASGLPSPDVIYSIIREPHHAAPFLDWAGFAEHWLGGYLMAGGMLAASLALARLPEAARLRGRALWLALLLLYLILTLVPAFIGRHTGTFGKFYLFRPAALVLLLWLALAASALVTLLARRRFAIGLLALALVAPPFLMRAADRVAGDWAGRAEAREKQALDDFSAAQVPSGVVVLIDPELEFANLDFERRTGHPSLVAWKFMPTNDPQILDWYRRMEFRKAVFAEGCAGREAYPVDFLLATPEHAAVLAKTCGAIVYRSARFTLLRRQ